MTISLYGNTMTVPSTELSKIKNTPAPFKRHLFIPKVKVSFPSSPPTFPSMKTFPPPSFVCLASKSQTEPAPLYKSVTCTSPPTLANFGCGFELICCAISGSGNMVTVTVNPDIEGGRVFVSNMVSMGVKDLHMLEVKVPLSYSAGKAALDVMQLLNVKSTGLSITIEKGVPLGADLGSTAAVAAAAGVAVNELFGAPLPRSDLVPHMIDSETKVSNYNYNIAAAILGGFVIGVGDPLEYKPFKYPPVNNLYFVILCLDFDFYGSEISERLSEYLDYEMLREEVPLSSCVSSILAGDPMGFGRAMGYDNPANVSIIPGWKSIKKVAMEAGAYGCSTAAMGLTVVAVTDCLAKGELIGEKMSKECEKQGINVIFMEVRRLKQTGTVVVNTDPPSV